MISLFYDTEAFEWVIEYGADTYTRKTKEASLELISTLMTESCLEALYE